MKVSIIAPYRERFNSEYDFLTSWGENVVQIDNCAEIILVNQDDKPLQRELHPKIKVIDLKYNGPFSRSWALNVGIRQAQSDIINILDVDCVCPTTYITNALSQLIKNKSVISYVMYMAHKKDTDNIIKDHMKIRKNADGRLGTSRGSRGMIMVYKEDMVKVGGYNEAFVGWGFEDNELLGRLEAINIKPKYITAHLHCPIHLWHVRPKRIHERRDYTPEILKLNSDWGNPYNPPGENNDH